jgi:IS30 family transposase
MAFRADWVKVSMSHETIYRCIYADKAIGGDLYKDLKVPDEAAQASFRRMKPNTANHWT